MIIGLIALLVLLAGDVIEQAANGFTSRNSASMSAPIDEVYDALANKLPAWWDVAHTYTGGRTQSVSERNRGRMFL